MFIVASFGNDPIALQQISDIIITAERLGYKDGESR